MNSWPDSGEPLIDRYVHTLGFETTGARRFRHRILLNFQHFVLAKCPMDAELRNTVTEWLRDRAAVFAQNMVVYHYGRYVDHFLDWLVVNGFVARNPFAELRRAYGQRTTAPIVRSLITADSVSALESIRPLPRFASHLGPAMREHLERMRMLGCRYQMEERHLVKFDRYLQTRPHAASQPLNTLVREWAELAASPQVQCQRIEMGRALAKHLGRDDPTMVPLVLNPLLRKEALRRRRRPYIYTVEEIRGILKAARDFPSPHAPLRPMTLFTMVILAYCVGLRLGEFVRLTLGDVDLNGECIEIRATKFFKSRRLPVSASVIRVLRQYLNMRRRAGAAVEASAPLFWNERKRSGYAVITVQSLLVSVLRRAGVKTERGRVGPRIHDFRHTFVVDRMTSWYREGINPQSRLPYLATFLGHKNIYSTLVYLTVTPQLIQLASERFRSSAALLRNKGETT